MAIGVKLSNEDLEAIAQLYEVRWSASIKNWKERDVDGCQWIVSYPDLKGNWIIRTGTSLAETIIRILKELDLYNA